MINKYWIKNTNGERLGYFTVEPRKPGTKKARNIFLEENLFFLRDFQDEKNPLITILEWREENYVSLLYSRTPQKPGGYDFYKGGETKDNNFIGLLKKKHKYGSISTQYWFVDPMERILFEMDGNVYHWKYVIYSGKRYARVHKKLFKGILHKGLIKGTYGVTINPDLDDDTAMLVLSAVAIFHYERKYYESPM